MPDCPESLRPTEGQVPVVLDPGGDLHCGFGARAECAYLVRPDGYIGYRAQPILEAHLMAHLDRLFVA